MNFLRIVFILLIFVLSMTHKPKAEASIQESDWDKLLNGKVIVEAVSDSNNIPGVRAIFVIFATREEIWKVLVDYDHFPQIFDGINKIEVIKEDENGAIVEFWINAVIKKVHYVLERKYVKPGYKLIWH